MTPTTILGFVDLSGPVFLGVFAGLFVVAAIVGAFNRERRMAPLNARASGVPTADLDVETLAVRRDGARGLVATALATLVRRGHAEIVTQGNVRGVDRPLGEVAGEEPLGVAEQKVLARLNVNRTLHGDEATVTTQALQGDLYLHHAELESAAMARGLIMSDEARSAVSFAGMWPWLIVLAIGIIKLVVGAGRGKPILFLLLMIIVGVFLMVAFKAPKILPATTTLLSRVEAQLAPLQAAMIRSPDMLTIGELGLVAAVFGVGMLGGQYSALNDAFIHTTSSTSCSSTSSCGSSCGGGCGGCGGCS